MPADKTNELSSNFSTIKLSDVARIAGVSVSTASRALTRPEMVSAETRELVQNTAKSAGYQPNLIARSLRTQSSNTIVVLVPSLESPFFPEIIRGLDWAAHARGYALMLGLTENDKDRHSSYAEIIRRQRPDGVVALDYHLFQLFGDAPGINIPTVQILEPIEGPRHHSVLVDDRAAAALATNHLLSLGHKRIAHIIGRDPSAVAALRFEGYKDALRDAGVEHDPALAVRGDFKMEGGLRGISELMALDEPPTAVFCANDETALGAILRLQQLGLSVPEDVSVIGFDDLERSAMSSPPLTTIRQPRFDIGTTAMELLIEAINDKSCAQKVVTLPVELVIRSSTAPPRGHRLEPVRA